MTISNLDYMLDFTLSIYKQVLLQSADSIVIAMEVNYINQRKVYYVRGITLGLDIFLIFVLFLEFIIIPTHDQ